MRGLGHYAYWWRRRILALALAVAVAGSIAGAGVFDAVKPFGFDDPSSESSRANDALESATGERPLPDVVVLLEGESRSELRREAKAVASDLRAVDSVQRVRTAGTAPELDSDDGRSTLVLGFLDAGTEAISDVGDEVRERFPDTESMTVGGAAVTASELNETTEDDLRRIELFAAPLLFILSFVVFRGFVAALIPVLVGALSILTTLLVLRLLANVMDVDAYVVNIVIGLGLGLAIDYSLFVISRFREQLEAGKGTPEATKETIGSMGRMILFSGLTVAAAMIALCVFPQRFLYSIGVGGAVVALSSVLVCLTALPALLAVLGPKVNALAPEFMRATRNGKERSRVARLVLRSPLIVVVAVSSLMLVAALPFLRVELRKADASDLPANSGAREVDRLISERYAADPSASVTILLRDIKPSDPDLADARTVLRRDPQVRDVSRPERVARDLVRLDASVTATDPQSDSAVDLVKRARALDWGGSVLIGGLSAELVDQRESLGEHLPYALALIMASTLLLLLALTRSWLIPVVSLIMNLLTVSAAFGILVLVFQDGNLEGLLGYSSPGALDTSMPILLFAVAFGLSTDYGVFLLQRIEEARREGMADRDAIAAGLTRSGRLITAAALLFAVAMGAFAFSDLVYIKEIAIGTALAVLIDATLMRALLLPATLCMLGRAAWWGPRRPGT